MNLCNRGTLKIAIHTDCNFCEDFKGNYKGIRFKYIHRCDGQTDCIVSAVVKGDEYTYEIISELISLFLFALEQKFIIGTTNWNLAPVSLEEEKGYLLERSLVPNKVSNIHGNPLSFVNLPLIASDEQKTLVRLYRFATAITGVDNIPSFLYFFHILDYSKDDPKGDAVRFINHFVESADAAKTYPFELIELINNDRVFEIKKDGAKYDGTLGMYLKFKVRDSVAHIIRYPKYMAKNLEMDTYKDIRHFAKLIELMKIMSRHKISHEHNLVQHCDRSVFSFGRMRS